MSLQKKIKEEIEELEEKQARLADAIKQLRRLLGMAERVENP